MSILTIEAQITELERNGWTRARNWQWRSPGGSLYLGPHGAWKAMRTMAGLAPEPTTPRADETQRDATQNESVEGEE